MENELMHYGVKGMKWGVRRAIGNKAKVAAHLERKAKTYNTSGVAAINASNRVAAKRARLGNSSKQASEVLRRKEKNLMAKGERNLSKADELYKCRNKAVKDLSEKDIAQGRQYLYKAGIVSTLLVGPLVGPSATLAREEYRVRKYLKNENR